MSVARRFWRHGKSLMEKLTDGKLAAAAARGRVVMRRDPRAESARYDSSGRIVVELVGGCAHVFPASLVQDLQGAGMEA